MLCDDPEGVRWERGDQGRLERGGIHVYLALIDVVVE